MKKTRALLFMLIFTITATCQQIPAPEIKIQRDYLSLSHTQKTIGWILVGTGAAICVLMSFDNNHASTQESWFEVNLNELDWIGYSVGGAMMASSIPLFSAAHRNKLKDEANSVFFRFEGAPGIGGIIKTKRYPAIGVNFNLK